MDMNLVPVVVDRDIEGERSYDIFSRLLKERIIFISGEINDTVANSVIAELLYLDSLSHDDISIYINSFGGSVYAGLSIYDTIKHLQNNNIEINTYAAGFCASMAAVLLISGTNRYSLPNSTIMFHSVSSNTNGKLNDMIVDVKETERLQNILNKIILENFMMMLLYIHFWIMI